MTLAAFGLGCVVGAVASLVGVLGLMVGAGIWFAALERGIEAERQTPTVHTSGVIARAEQRCRKGWASREAIEREQGSPLEWNGWPSRKN